MIPTTTRQTLAIGALIMYGTVLLVAIPVGRLGTEVRSRRKQAIVGCCVGGLAIAISICTPWLHEAGVKQAQMSSILYITAVVYGLGSVLVAVGDMGLTLELIPEGVGNGAAMAVTAPSVTVGFVIGRDVVRVRSFWVIVLCCSGFPVLSHICSFVSSHICSFSSQHFCRRLRIRPSSRKGQFYCHDHGRGSYTTRSRSPRTRRWGTGLWGT